MIKNKKPEPTFDKQISVDYNIIDGSDPIFSHAYHKFMVNLLTTRDKAVKNELSNEVDELLKVSNEKICGDVIEYLQINLLPLKTNIDLLVDSQQSIKLDIGHIKNEIAGVRQQVKNIETENNNVHGEIKLIIDTLDKRTKTWKLWVWAVIIIGISVTLTFLLF